MAQSVKCPSSRAPKRFSQRLTVPEKWFDYKAIGEVIEGTNIIAVKTPLKKEYNNGHSRKEGWVVDYQTGVCVEDEFTPQQLVERVQTEKNLKLSAVLDLTYTDKYYKHFEFEKLGVRHTKIKCPGHDLPSDSVYCRFVSALKESLSTCEGSEAVVAVHCTHGINRTGYLVCRFLIQEKGFSADAAIAGFNKARGHDIERPNYLEHLKNGCPPSTSQLPSQSCAPMASHPAPLLPVPTLNPPPPPPYNSQHVQPSMPHHQPFRARGNGRYGWHDNSYCTHRKSIPWREQYCHELSGRDMYTPPPPAESDYRYWNSESLRSHQYSHSTRFVRHHPYWS